MYYHILHVGTILTSVLARNLFKRVHNEIHNLKKPSEVLPSQVFQVVAKSNQRANSWKRAHFFPDQTTNGTLEDHRARCPSLEA